jgi:glycosyltransferase involved in cell wall biosynthesis
MSPVLASSAKSQSGPILQIIPELDAGGAERTTVDIAEALTQSGFKALVASRGGRLEAELGKVGGELIRMNAASKAPHMLFANALALRDIIRTRDVALVHARSRAPAWSAMLAAQWSGVPFVVTYHGFYKASNPFKRFYNSVMVRGDAVIANSQWTADHITSEYSIKPTRLVVIPRGVDIVTFDPARLSQQRVSELRAEWKVAAGDFVVLLPGRLTRWKGQSVLIDAMSRLAKAGQLGSIRAILAGDAQGRDAYEAELRAAIAHAALSDRVRIVGHVSDMVTAYGAAADVVLSTSTEPEAFGRVAAEASAMMRPVIATDHGGARETVLSGISGFLVAPGDAAALAEALLRIQSMGAEARTQMGAAGRAHIVKNFSREKMCDDTISLYRSLLA